MAVSYTHLDVYKRQALFFRRHTVILKVAMARVHSERRRLVYDRRPTSGRVPQQT